MPAKDAFTGACVREWNLDMTIEPAGPYESCIETIRAIAGAHDDDAIPLFDAIKTLEQPGDHLDVVLGVFAFEGLPVAESVDFVEE